MQRKIKKKKKKKKREEEDEERKEKKTNFRVTTIERCVTDGYETL